MQNSKHSRVLLQQSRRQKLCGGKVRGPEGLFRVGLFDERLMCHQIDGGLFVCAQMSSRDRYGYGNGLQIEKAFYYFEFLMD